MSGSSVAQAVLADLAYFYGRAVPATRRASRSSAAGPTIGITDAARGDRRRRHGQPQPRRPATRPGLVLTPFALSGVCLVTNGANPVPGLTRAQVQDSSPGG